MEAVAAFVDGDGEPPPELTYYLLTKNWGNPDGRGWGQWPARWFTRVRLARNVYQVWGRYVRAENRAKFTDETGIVGLVKEGRYGNDELRVTSDELRERVGVWEMWEGIEESDERRVTS